MLRILALATVLAALLVPPATATKPMQSERAQQASLKVLAKRIETVRVSTWKCQDRLDLSRYETQYSRWSLPPSIPFRRWVLDRWQHRHTTCQVKLRERTIPASGDWRTSVALVQRAYPGTADWLLYISRREGGHGGFVMNHAGSGAGGWMQFMSSTYYAYNDRAYADIRARGFIVDESTNSWTHPMGQAITAGYMRYVGLDGCHWCL